MNKTAIFYSFNSHKTAKIGEKITELFGKDKIDVKNAEVSSKDDLLQYENLILGVPTWFDGELPNYWDELLPDIESSDFKGKKVAIYGLGDQKNYPENFCDGIGIMAYTLQSLGAEIVGYTQKEGYHYEASKAEIDGRFVGLLLDQENQARLTNERVQKWILVIQNEFKL